MPGEPALEVLRRRLGFESGGMPLLRQALAHRSWCAEHGAPESNERLEFLGDAILGAIVAEYVYRTYPGLPEGQLTDARKSVVNARALAEAARTLELGPAILLGKGEMQAGGREKTSILSDAFEAVLAAVYLDRGWPAATELVLELLRSRIDEAIQGLAGRDYKSLLHELVGSALRYDVRSEGPDHAKRFTARVLIAGVERGVGEGRSKKQAEQAAARRAWDDLEASRARPANDEVLVSKSGSSDLRASELDVAVTTPDDAGCDRAGA